MTQARAGVPITMSGESARRERSTVSLLFCVILTVCMSLAQKAENSVTALKTCCANSRVGTNIRAEVCLGAFSFW